VSKTTIFFKDRFDFLSSQLLYLPINRQDSLIIRPRVIIDIAYVIVKTAVAWTIVQDRRIGF